MLGFNWVDLIIIVTLVAVVAEGVRIGVLSQLFVITAFFGTLIVSGWVFPHLVSFDDTTLRTTVNGTLVLLISIYAAMRGFDLGQKIHWSFRFGNLRKNRNFETAETILGCVPGLAAGIVLVWLLGVTIGRLPFVGLSNSVNDAQIMQILTRELPPTPAVFAAFNSHIDPNAQPDVYVRPAPQKSFNYDPHAVQLAADRGARFVVRITSFTCGAIVSGSGFAISSELVATNAHAIAGSRRPIIKYGGKSFEGVPIYFDALLDLAVIRVPGLRVPSLGLSTRNISLDTSVAVLGYPGGDYQSIPGIIRDTRAATSTNIYSLGNFDRGVYVVQAHVSYGNSGGPIVLQNGQAAGIIFSKSTSTQDTGYALTASHISDALRQIKYSQRRVGTGACVAD